MPKKVVEWSAKVLHPELGGTAEPEIKDELLAELGRIELPWKKATDKEGQVSYTCIVDWSRFDIRRNILDKSVDLAIHQLGTYETLLREFGSEEPLAIKAFEKAETSAKLAEKFYDLLATLEVHGRSID